MELWSDSLRPARGEFPPPGVRGHSQAAAASDYQGALGPDTWLPHGWLPSAGGLLCLTPLRLCVRVFVCAYVCAFSQVCMHVWVCVCRPVCVCMFVCECLSLRIVCGFM